MTILARDWFHDSWGVGTAERVSSKSKEWSRGKNEQAFSTLPPKMMMIMDLCPGKAYLTNEPFIKVEIGRARGEKRASNPFTRSTFKIKRGAPPMETRCGNSVAKGEDLSHHVFLGQKEWGGKMSAIAAGVVI